MNGLAQSVVLVLIGSVVLRISVSDVYLRYVKEGLRPYLIAAGIILVAMAVVTGWRELRDDPDDEPDGQHADDPGEPHADDGHGHSHSSPMIAWLLMLPIFAIFLIAPPALGSYAASRAGSAAVTKRTEFAPLPAGDPVRISTIDYATRGIWEQGASMKGRTLRLTGFLSPRPGGGFYLTRIILSCCAADGRPLKIGLTGKVPQGLKADDWLEVDGTYSSKTDKDSVMHETIAYVDVTSHRRIAAPEQPYEQ